MSPTYNASDLAIGKPALIRNLDAAGATVQAFNQVEFPTTPLTSDHDQWQVVSVVINTRGSVSHVYARLELQSADIVYLDAVWTR